MPLPRTGREKFTVSDPHLYYWFFGQATSTARRRSDTLHSPVILVSSSSNTTMLARPVLCVAFLVLAGVTAWPNGAGLKSCTLGQPGGSELGGGWTTHGDHMVAEGRGPYRLTVKGLEVGGTYDPKGIYQMTLSSVNGTSIIQGFMVSPNVRHGTGRTFSGKVREWGSEGAGWGIRAVGPRVYGTDIRVAPGGVG